MNNSLNTQTVNLDVIFASTHTLNSIKGGTMIINGIISGAGGATKTGGGTVTLTNANTYAGATAVNAGTLKLNFAAAGAPAANIISASSALQMGGGALNIQGAASGTNSQAFASATFAGALSSITVTPGVGGTASLALGNIVHNLDAAVRFGTTGTVTAGTVTTSTGGILGAPGGLTGAVGFATSGYATVGLDDFAALSGGAIVGGASVAAFYQNTYGLNFDMIANTTLANGGAQRAANVVRWNTPGATTLTAGTGNLVTFTGALTTPSMGANNAVFNTGAGGARFAHRCFFFPAPRVETRAQMENDLGKVIEALLSSYQTGGGTNHVDGANLPSKRAVATTCEDLLQLLFPGFHDAEPIHSSHITRVTSHRVHSISEHLSEEICKSLRLDEPDCPNAQATKLAYDFLSGLPRVRELLATDVAAAFAGDPAAGGTDEIILSYPFLEAIAIQRSAHLLYALGVPLIPRMMTEWAHSRTGIDIHPGAHIGSHFFIDHGTGVVIGETSILGHHVKLYQGVSLIARSLAGGQSLRGQRRHPSIEDHVTIYANATIMGGDTIIGSGSTIGASVFLIHSVPPRSLVLAEGQGVKVLDKNQHGGGADDWMI